mmetsp:Transcript_60042/g.161776  ORF Transcript_60042/g.161776 Transcript_60042/m.161776 type:complete len:296 (-) Transcript_60042:81-968(-)
MAHWAPLISHHLRTVSANFGDLSCSFGETTKSTAKLAAASRASRSSSSSLSLRSASSRNLRSNSSSASSPVSDGVRPAESAAKLKPAPRLPSNKPNAAELTRPRSSSKGSRSSIGSSSFFILSFQTLTMSSPHISFNVETTMKMSLPVSPQTMLGPNGMPKESFSSRPSTPLPLSNSLPAALGKSSMSVPVSCMSSVVPSGSSSSLTALTAAMKRRLSGSGTVPAGSLRAMVTSPNLRCNPEPMPKNFMLPGCEHSAKMRRCNSSTSSRCSWGRSAASTTRCVFKSKYSRPFEPV